MKHESTKTYGHEQGLSCAFRQWRAKSHCNQIHGYALSFKFTFGANDLDERNWVVDFGGLKELKSLLVQVFDHTVAVAHDDPMSHHFQSLQSEGVAKIQFMQSVGCESFAEMAFWMAHEVIQQYNTKGGKPRVYVLSCECAEHGANSAIFKGAVQ